MLLHSSFHPFCTLESAFFKVVYVGCVTELTQIDNPTRRWGINGCDGWCGVVWREGVVGGGRAKDERGEQTNCTQNWELTAKFVVDTKM